jgi:hypothetical protein
MGVRTELLLAGDPGLAALAPQMEVPHLYPTQLEHEVSWIARSDHGTKASAAVLALFRDDRLAAYAPLRYRWDGLAMKVAGKRLGALPYRTIQLFGPGVISADEELIPAALSAIDRLPWRFDAFNLFDVPVHSAFWRAVEARALTGFDTLERARHPHYLVDLPDGIDEYMARFSGKSRATFRRKARRLEQECGALSVRTYSRRDEVPALLETIAPVFLKTYHHHLRGENLTPSNEQLARNLTRWADHGWLRAYVLFAAERPIAYVIGSLARRRFSYEMPGYDPEQSAHSPGLLLLLRMIEDLVGHRSASVLDFGSGDNDYKQLFATRSYVEVSALLVRRTARARGIAGLYREFARATRAGALLLERHQVKARVLKWLRGGRTGNSAPPNPVSAPVRVGAKVRVLAGPEAPLSPILRTPPKADSPPSVDQASSPSDPALDG